MFGSQKPVESPIQKLRRSSKKEINAKTTKLTSDAKPVKGSKVKEQDHQNDANDSKNLLSNIKIKHELESDSESSSFVDPVSSPKHVRKQRNSVEKIDIKQEIVDTKYSDSVRYAVQISSYYIILS